MTDNEIVKALECCIETTGINCGECPYCDDCVSDENTSHIMTDTLDLINRLQAEKEALIAGQETLQKYIAEQKAEIERLQKENHLFADIGKMYSEVRAEAVKEFAERVKDLFPEEDKITRAGIDNLLKEVVGEQREEDESDVQIDK